MGPFDHERLEVYRRSLEVARACETVAALVPESRRDLVDQLRRASASVHLNVAEGAAEFSAADKARFYRMARRSAAECAAILDLLDALGVARAQVATVKRDLGVVAAMLTRLVASAETRARARRAGP